MSADYFALAACLMMSSAEETCFDREIRAAMSREFYGNPPYSIQPVPGAVAPVLGEVEDEIERARRTT